MIRDDDIEKIMKKMIQEIFGLTDEQTKNLQFFRSNMGDGPFNVQAQPKQEIVPIEIEPLIEIHNNDKYYSILIETSGYSEEQLFINIKKEKGVLNLIFGIQDADGRMHLRRMPLPDDATEKFEREYRGSVVELIVQKAK